MLFHYFSHAFDIIDFGFVFWLFFFYPGNKFYFSASELVLSDNLLKKGKTKLTIKIYKLLNGGKSRFFTKDRSGSQIDSL